MSHTHLATQHIRDILALTVKHSEKHTALIVFDTQCPLAMTLTAAYQRLLPTATYLNFDTTPATDIFAAFKKLSPFDLVVLIQSANFRLQDFRIRVDLFEQSLKVIEHPRLARMQGIEQTYYIESLAYDPIYYHGIGHALKKLIDSASCVEIDSGGERLIFGASLEPAKMNIGDYTNMKNIGGQFPIGEVFTESKLLEAVEGRVRIFAFADSSYTVNKPNDPITLVVNKGRVTDILNSTPAFDEVMETIRADEGEIWLRELGFGMNRAFSKDRIVSDIGTYERMCGIHLSLGAKHGVYKKSNFKRGTTWHHVDVFAVTDKVYIDNKNIFENDSWKI